MDLTIIPIWIRLAGTFALGAVVGSFANVCIYRLPWRMSVIRPGSRCPHCDSPIRWYDNIPIVSWLLLLGRCRHCHQRISFRYLTVELLTAGLFALLYWMEVEQRCLDVVNVGLAVPAGDVGSAVLHWRYLYHIALLTAMIVASFIDLDYQIIPDSVTVPGMLVGLGMAFVVSEVHLVQVSAPLDVHPWFTRHPHMHGLAVSVVGLVVGGGLVWSVRVIGSLALGKEAMGFGDVTLMAMIGSFIGWQAAILVFILAPILALIVGGIQWILRGETAIPYGPYLCLATLATLLRWNSLWEEFAQRLEFILSLGWWLVPMIATMAALLALLLVAMRITQAVARRRANHRTANNEHPEAEPMSAPTSGPTPEIESDPKPSEPVEEQ